MMILLVKQPIDYVQGVEIPEGVTEIRVSIIPAPAGSYATLSVEYEFDSQQTIVDIFRPCVQKWVLIGGK